MHFLKFFLETFGCSLNTADSDLIVGRLHLLGFIRSELVDDADVIILNTCGVKEPTEDKIIHKLGKLSEGEIPVVITGCLPKISFDRVKKAIPDFGAILGPQSITSMGAILQQVVKGVRGIIHVESDDDSKLQFFEGPPDSVICTVPICEGCLGNCAYCAVRFARDELKSYKIDELRNVVERCVHLGYLEIRLTAQDAGAFGRDTDETLPMLLDNLAQIPGNHRFRLGMFNPNLVIESLPEMLEALDTENYFQFFHVPLQSGDDRVLQAMHRRYTVQDWENTVSAIRNKFPNATIATDIIVGFPTETDAEFDNTLEIVQKVKPSVINVSKYGDRPGTQSSKSTEKVHTLVKKERSRTLTKIVDEIIEERNKSWVGWEGFVIATNSGSKGGIICRNPSYKSVIVHDDLQIGSIHNVKVISAKKTHLVGNIISD
ncbi:MAG: tRNA (N(6)-L-threonylcarbamoyladenosine(37)-C(2))-methylthiotransferase [Candidatus Thorarchaeota archaeon]